MRQVKEEYLQALYGAWAELLYPSGRTNSPARLLVAWGSFGDSGYHRDKNIIEIAVPACNEEDLDSRIGSPPVTTIDRWKLLETEIALIHEMMHERQFRETRVVSPTGLALFSQFGPTAFPGPGHDEWFYTAIADSAAALGMEPVALVRNI